jgi:hypothetical protein|tara:strand:+ start:675 stop:842 length:168 start_codon:yes stop_codon:yes gene_type:complete
MAWKLKKEYENKTLDNLKVPLNQLSQKQIKGLREHFRNKFFEQDKPKQKKNELEG